MNQPHDSICGCSIDDVHKDMECRTDLINALLNDELNDVSALLLSKIDTTNTYKNKGLVVFNTASYKRDIIIENDEVILVKNVPAFGYKVVTKNEESNDKLILNKELLTIENSKILVSINSNGSINIFDKKTKSFIRESRDFIR